MRLRRAIIAAASAAAIAGALFVAPTAVPAAHADPSYPSWADVQAALASQAATQAEITKINGLIGQLQSAADAAGNLEIKRAADYGAAETALNAATQKAQSLSSQAATATQRAGDLTQRSGLLESQLWRSGGSDLSVRIFFGGSGSSSLLSKLGNVTRLTAQAKGLLDQAKQAKNLAASLSAQAAAAESARQTLDVAAQKALAAAQQAQQAANTALATQQQQQTVMIAQLATLKNTTVQVEQQYAAGQAAAAAYSAAHSGEGGSNSFAPPPGVVVNPAEARAYAGSVVPQYGWNGSQMQCLIWLWTRESGWRTDAYNTSSGAYGIPQSLPASKMATAGADWATSSHTQINWGLRYIKSSYGSPCAAWAHETAHSWY